MAVTGDWYGLAKQSAMQGKINVSSDTLKGMLLTSGYTPSLNTHQFKSDLVASEVSTVATTTAASAAAGATTLSLTASIPVGAKIQTGTGGTLEYHEITAITGAGPYTATLDAAMSNAIASGAAVTASPGYTAGGATLSSVTYALTTAASAAAAAVSTAYVVGQVVRPAASNGFVYRATVAGTSGASAPTWPTVIGQTVTDGGVTWTCIGTAYLVLNTAAASWATSAIKAQYLALYDSTPASDATRPLLGLVNFGTSLASLGGTFQVSPDTAISGWLIDFVS
jgi:hypothetical protein